MAKYDNAQCAHVWAQQNRESGESHNGNLNFEGPVIRSYRTPIARFTETVDGRRAVLVTSQQYSMTTSCKHMPAVWRAIDYGRGDFAPCFTVPHVYGRSGLGYTHFDLSAENHAENLAHLVSAYDNCIAKARRSRGCYPGLHDDLDKLADAARDYAAAFGLPLDRGFDVDADAAAVMAHHAEREAKRNAPGAAEKRERDRIARAERKARKEAQTREEAIADWRAGRGWTIRHGYATDSDGGALLRVEIGRGLLRTSLGATVPLEDAVRVFRMAKLCRERGATWHRNGATLPVGTFAVDRIEPDGSFRAGCHRINWPEIEAAALAAGVADITAEDTTQPRAVA